jgi:hypothetical protein
MSEETHTPKTDAELRQIAMDIYHGHIFTDRSIRNKDDLNLLSMIFMPLALMGKEGADQMIERKVSMVYEYLDRAGPRSVNGYPTFMSMKYLTEDEVQRLVPIFERYEKLQEEFTQQNPA